MDRIENVQHPGLHDGKWDELTFPQQMGNIGSEVSRMLRWREKGNHERSEKAFYRALELLDLTIATVQYNNLSDDRTGMDSVRTGKMKELCRAREELCNLFMEAETMDTDPVCTMRYYDQFAMLSTR